MMSLNIDTKISRPTVPSGRKLDKKLWLWTGLPGCHAASSLLVSWNLAPPAAQAVTLVSVSMGPSKSCRHTRHHQGDVAADTADKATRQFLDIELLISAWNEHQPNSAQERDANHRPHQTQT